MFYTFPSGRPCYWIKCGLLTPFVFCYKPFVSKISETHFELISAAVWLPALDCVWLPALHCDYSYHCPPSGTKFLCSEVIAPIKSEVDDICLYIINFEDLTAPSAPAEEGVEANHKLSKCEWRLESWTWKCLLTFRHRASSVQDRRFATLQRTLFIYLMNKYISLSDICLIVHHWYK